MGFQLGPRRGVYVDIAQENQKPQLPADDLAHFEQLDLMIIMSRCPGIPAARSHRDAW